MQTIIVSLTLAEMPTVRAPIQFYVQAINSRVPWLRDVSHMDISAKIETITNPFYGAVTGFTDDAVIFRCVKEGKIWEPHLVAQFSQFIKPGTIVLDCGANIGLHAMAMLKSQPELREVMAFEPHPQIFPLLQQNVAALGKITALQLALREDSEQLFSSTITNFANPGGATMKRQSANQAAPTAGGVASTSLDSLNIKNVSLIKIDVEGYEMPVIEGAKKLLADQRPVLIVEIWDLANKSARQAKIDRICSLGYRSAPISSIDMLFVPLV